MEGARSHAKFGVRLRCLMYATVGHLSSNVTRTGLTTDSVSACPLVPVFLDQVDGERSSLSLSLSLSLSGQSFITLECSPKYFVTIGACENFTPYCSSVKASRL